MSEPIILSEQRSGSTSILAGVYGWMSFALAITGLIAFFTASSDQMVELIFGNRFLFYGLLFGELGLVWYLSARIASLSNSAAIGLFILYSVLNGLTLSVLLMVYTASSVAATFFITAGTFGVMSLVGYYTKKDLTAFGQLMFMLLIGVIIATVVNFFMQSESFGYIISYVGVMVFVGLIAYDTQKIKRMSEEAEGSGTFKLTILGALTLYLDFINLFIFLLRLLGGRK
jgi:FtsH-binding integral membrane protein